MQGEPFPRARLRGRHCASPHCRWLPSNCFSPPSTIRRRHPGRRPPRSEPRGDRWSPPRSEPRGDRWSSPRSVPTACHHRCGGAALRMPQPQHERLVSEPWSERVSLELSSAGLHLRRQTVRGGRGNYLAGIVWKEQSGGGWADPGPGQQWRQAGLGQGSRSLTFSFVSSLHAGCISVLLPSRTGCT